MTVVLQRMPVPASSAPAGRPLIRLDDVAKTYRTADGPVESLKPLTFEIRDSEFMAIVGPSGCGKSTLLKMVAGLLPASAGTIAIDGKPVNSPPDDVGMCSRARARVAIGSRT
jgi:NitT/TauT family transport system ATP-binding protein